VGVRLKRTLPRSSASTSGCISPASITANAELTPGRCRRSYLLVAVAAVALLPATGWGQTNVSQASPPAAVPPAVQVDQIPISADLTPAFLPEAPSRAEAIGPAVGKAKKVPAKYDIRRIGERGIGQGVNFYSLEKEDILGKRMAGQVERSSRLIKDPVITEYINQIGQKIVRNSDAKVPFTIKVIDSDEVNAFALPGGYFYVNSGLIEAADNEAELAGAMAHEIAHVAARHGTRSATKSRIWNMASVPLIFVGGPVGYGLEEAAGVVGPLSFFKFTRNAEREADLLGLQYAYQSGYDPRAFVDLFERLEAQEKKHRSTLAKAFSTHPMTADRVKWAEQDIADYLPPRPEYLVTTSEFDVVKARLSQLTNRLRLNKGNQTPPTLRRPDSSNSGRLDWSHNGVDAP
jgi:predicted Zn-dependent protease